MALDEDIRRLGRIAVFAALERDALRLIAFSGEKRTFAPGEHLYRAGEKADCGWFILSGDVVVESGGRRQTLGPDMLAGESAMLADVERVGEARAVTAVEAMRIPRALVLRVLREFPDSAVGLHKALAERLRELTAKLDTARRRVIEPKGY